MTSWRVKPSSLRLRLLISMIGSVVVISAVAMVLDYRHERRRGLDRITASLEEQASALQSAHTLIEDPNEFGRYVDEFCATMDDRISPGHHILVLNPDGSVFAASQRHSGRQVERALQETTRRRAVEEIDGHRLAYVRSYDQDGHTFVLAQYLDRVEAALHERLRRRAVSLGLIALTIALFVYLAVACWVIGPLESLVHAARRWTVRDFAARASSSGPSDIRVVSREFNSMADELEMHERRREEELEEAREIQANLLGKFSPEIGGLKLAVEYRPATHVAGDLYDAFALADGRIALVILDVSGHGINAAMLTGLAKISLRRCLTACSDLSEAMRHVNSDVYACTSDSYFVTACVGIWNPDDGRWTYCGAGHPGGILIREGNIEELPATAPLLGVLPDGQWETASVSLSPQDRVFLYTDGIVETRIAGEFFGLDGLGAVLQRTCHRSLAEQVEAVMNAVRRSEEDRPSDDATVFAFEYHCPTCAEVPGIS